MGPKAKKKTRHTSGSCFGDPANLPDTGQLYTLKDILAAFELEKTMNPDATSRKCAEKIAPKVIEKWIQSNPRLILISEESLVCKITTNYDKAKAVNWNRLKAKERDIFLGKIDILFDILKCTCPIELCDQIDCPPAYCQNGVHIKCTCKLPLKIPPMELRFIKNQRDNIGLLGGKMQIQCRDKKEAKRQERTKKKEMIESAEKKKK